MTMTSKEATTPAIEAVVLDALAKELTIFTAREEDKK